MKQIMITSLLLLLLQASQAYGQDCLSCDDPFEYTRKLYSDMERELAPKAKEPHQYYIEDVYGDKHYYNKYGFVVPTINTPAQQ